MRTYRRVFLGYFLIVSLLSCSLLYQTIKIDVPKGYIGWVYIIPVKDTSGLLMQKVNGKYQLNENGVAYIPTTELDIKKDSRILVYEGSKDISNDMRYTGSVYKVKRENRKYEYIQFYLPPLEVRKIANGTQHWRDKAWEYGGRDRSKFDSLLNDGKIVFK